MPNRVLLVFDPAPSGTSIPQSSHHSESKLHIATEVVRKSFWKTGPDLSSPNDVCWLPVISVDEIEPPNETPPLNSAENRRERLFAKLQELETDLEENPEADAPCIAIVDLAIAYYGLGARSPDECVDNIRRLLVILRSKGTLVFLVATERSPHPDQYRTNAFRGLYHSSAQLARTDTNIWDALYNIVRRGEHQIRLRDAERLGTHLTIKAGDNLHLPHDLPHGDTGNGHLYVNNQLDFSINRLPDADDTQLDRVFQHVVFNNCLIDEMDLANLVFENGVSFHNCKFSGRVRIRFSEFQNVLHFRDCTFEDDVTIENTSFKYRTPWFYKCRFQRRMVVRRCFSPIFSDAESTPTLMIARCEFSASNRFDMPQQRMRLTFFSSRFSDGEYTEINWLRSRNDTRPPIRNRMDFHTDLQDPKRRHKIVNSFEPLLFADYKRTDETSFLDELKDDTCFYSRIAAKSSQPNDAREGEITDDVDVYVRFINCGISGRIVLREDPQVTRFFRDPTLAGVLLSFEGSLIHGVIDLTEVRVRSIDAERANFSDGALVMNNFQTFPLHASLPGSPNFSWPICWSAIALLSAICLFRQASPIEYLYVVCCVYILSTLILAMTNEQFWPKGDINQRSLLSRIVQKCRLFFSIHVPTEFTGILYAERIMDGLEKWRFADILTLESEILSPHQLAKRTAKQQSKVRNICSYKQVIYSSIAQQYEDLKNAFAHAPVVDELEDFCHYKALKYRNEANGASITTLMKVVARFYLACAGAFGVYSAWIFSEENRINEIVFSTAYMFVLLALVAVPVAMKFISVRGKFEGHTFFEEIRYLSERAIFEELIAYGVYPRRVVISAGLVVILYAAFYLLAIHSAVAGIDLQLGDIVMNGTNEWSEPPIGIVEYRSTSQLSCAAVLSDLSKMLYFSAVTFTTLGYGDMHSTGFLRLVSASEAFVGAMMIALITVALVRRVLRR